MVDCKGLARMSEVIGVKILAQEAIRVAARQVSKGAQLLYCISYPKVDNSVFGCRRGFNLAVAKKHLTALRIE